MKFFKNIMLQVLLYLCLFTSAFFLVSYFSELEILTNIQYQLYIGVIALILSIIFILLSMKLSKDKNEEKNMDEVNDNEIYEEEQKEQIAFDFDNQEVSENNTVEALNKEINLEEQNTLSNDQLEINTEQDDDVAANYEFIAQDETFGDDEIKSSEQMNDESNEEMKESKTEKSTEAVKMKFNYDEIKDKIDPNLTNTQAMYIDKSTNSYFDENGMPQLSITSNIDIKEFKLKLDEFEVQPVKEKTIDEIIEDENLLNEEESFERKSDILTIIIVVLIILIVIAALYFVITSFVG